MIDEKLGAIYERVDKYEQDIEKLRGDFLTNSLFHREQSEQLAERSKQLETDVFDYTDNQQLQIQQLKNQINEMSEKLEYDNRRIQREFNEKLDNIYECIEKLELGRLRAEKTRQEPEAIAGLKDAVIAIFTGVLALIFYILTFLSFLMAPLTKNPLRSTVAITVLIFAIIFYSKQA